MTAHADLCPVCKGKGVIFDTNGLSASPPLTCRGCGGKGWVTVQDNPVQLWHIEPEIKEIHSHDGAP